MFHGKMVEKVVSQVVICEFGKVIYEISPEGRTDSIHKWTTQTSMLSGGRKK